MRTCEMCMMMDDCKIGNVRMCILDTPSPLKLVRYQLVFKLFCVISLLCVQRRFICARGISIVIHSIILFGLWLTANKNEKDYNKSTCAIGGVEQGGANA